MEAKYIINAIAVLERCAKGMSDYTLEAEERGRLSAHATIAAIQLRVYSGIDEAQIEVESNHVPS